MTYVYETKADFWNSQDVNTKTTTYASGLVSPYANVTKAGLERWGDNCHKKCGYEECSTARRNIDVTLKLVLKAQWPNRYQN